MNITYILKTRLENNSIGIYSIIDKMSYLASKLDEKTVCEYETKRSDATTWLEHKPDCMKCEIFNPLNKWLLEGDVK